MNGIYETNIEFIESMRAMYNDDLMMKPVLDDVEQVLLMCSKLDENPDLFQPTMERTEKDITVTWQYKNKDDESKHYILQCTFSKDGMKKQCNVKLDDGTLNELNISYYVSDLLVKTIRFYIQSYTDNLFA